ncbi:MAG: 2-oxoglutarate dehydrogenase, E2 component, dihydrolipoamide succinyltransferase [Gemmatimonadetes bacterium]|nr:MAG: 2-oxoglutarate dehydrogenase, E2 component, dihydrolipoamide succinyltransferase [Gemmatimonadota bacterium]
MPQMGESIAEGTLSKWLKKVGDEVKRDEPIFEISTDKVDAEIPAPAAGVLAEIIVKEGETVAVQTVVARLETEKGAVVGKAEPAPSGAGTSAPVPSALAQAGAKPTPGAPPAPQREVTAPSTPVRQQPPAPAIAASHAGNGNSFEDRVRTKSSPLVRKIAAEHGVNISSLHGTGVAGRVTKRDILGFIDSGAPATAVGGRYAPPGARALPLPEAWPGDVVEPMSKMRALISEHMVASRHTSAHVTSFIEIDFTRVARIRASKRAEFEAATGQKLTYMPFIIKAVTQGLQAFPVMNSSVAGTNIIYRKQINIGVAVALDWGLIVPVIKHADDLSLSGITRALNDLAARARAKKLSPEEVQEGTFTITNPGVFGSLMGTPIINQPQVAILGVGAIEKRPKILPGADGEDTIAIRTCAYFSISFDHRIIDGAIADQFLAFLKKTIETFPETGL